MREQESHAVAWQRPPRLREGEQLPRGGVHGRRLRSVQPREQSVRRVRLREHAERDLRRRAQLCLVCMDVGVVDGRARRAQAEHRPRGQRDVRLAPRLRESASGHLVRQEELLRRDRERGCDNERAHAHTTSAFSRRP